MTDKELTFERIKNEAIDYANFKDRILTSYNSGLREGYKEGAISERNNTAQQAIEIMNKWLSVYPNQTPKTEDLINSLETLKL